MIDLDLLMHDWDIDLPVVDAGGSVYFLTSMEHRRRVFYFRVELFGADLLGLGEGIEESWMILQSIQVSNGEMLFIDGLSGAEAFRSTVPEDIRINMIGFADRGWRDPKPKFAVGNRYQLNLDGSVTTL